MDRNFHVRVPMRSVTEHITMHVNVTGVRTWKIRVWVGTQLIRLAAFVMNCNVVVDTEAHD